MDEDIWGYGYQIVTRKIARQRPEGAKDPATMQEIVSAVFPYHRDKEDAEVPIK